MTFLMKLATQLIFSIDVVEKSSGSHSIRVPFFGKPWKAMGAPMSTPTCPTHDRATVDLALLVVRGIAGIIFAAHGSQKLFGAFDGQGLAKTVEMLGPLGYPVTIGEFFG